MRNLLVAIATAWLALLIGVQLTLEKSQQDAIRAGAGSYQTDPQTGVRDFVYGCPTTEVQQ